MKNIEYSNAIQENKRLYNQYIILLPESKAVKHKYDEQLTKIIKHIRKNKIEYEKYCSYIYFLKKNFEVDITFNNNIYRENEYDSDNNSISDIASLNNII